MSSRELLDTAMALLADDKGLLAMDEGNPTSNKRFAKLGIPQPDSSSATAPLSTCGLRLRSCSG
jgi:fructose-bisphosphate aldolase class I